MSIVGIRENKPINSIGHTIRKIKSAIFHDKHELEKEKNENGSKGGGE